MANQELDNLKDADGQVSFAAAVYFDPEMTDTDKLYWLEITAGEGKEIPPDWLSDLRQKTGADSKAEVTR